MNELTKEEIDAMNWMDDMGIKFDQDLADMASRNWRNQNERYYAEKAKREGPGTLIAATCLGAVVLAIYVVFVHWAVK